MLPNAAAETPPEVHGETGAADAADAADAAAYPFWTPARDAELLALYARTGPERLLREEIAERMGVSFCAVRNRLHRLGAPTGTPGEASRAPRRGRAPATACWTMTLPYRRRAG
ncbi:hypothetical protein M0638_27665 [Roseomonas sp. NAR14]|uniref:Uncharacterized protein n=1 Tax=Roseomonas acroporae TaxID=2937791 RepID=A0A9X1YDG9_9PROT|nr:hypothetical protein [Roseomonas acroporae]MCK8788136.1 hypothetical protein [Roseomonas acroporae]